MKLLFIDTETGGLDPARYSILSVGLVVLSDNEIADTLEIKIREPEINACDEALQVNNIVIDSHIREAIPPLEAVNQVLAFIRKCQDLYSDKGKIIICGHNVLFDIAFIKRLFGYTSYKYDDYFSHRIVDTSSILRYLYIKGDLPDDISNLDAALDHFGINEYPRHTALKDALLTALLFSRVVNL